MDPQSQQENYLVCLLVEHVQIWKQWAILFALQFTPDKPRMIPTDASYWVSMHISRMECKLVKCPLLSARQNNSTQCTCSICMCCHLEKDLHWNWTNLVSFSEGVSLLPILLPSSDSNVLRNLSIPFSLNAWSSQCTPLCCRRPAISSVTRNMTQLLMFLSLLHKIRYHLNMQCFSFVKPVQKERITYNGTSFLPECKIAKWGASLQWQTRPIIHVCGLHVQVVCTSHTNTIVTVYCLCSIHSLVVQTSSCQYVR